ncbi:hypothetical protein AAG906_034418 [Vitis piasezkii]
MELGLKVESRICGYRWSIDLVIALDSHQSSDSSVEMSDELAATLASIRIESSRQDHHPIGISTDDTVPHVPQMAQVLPLGTSHGITPPPAATVLPPMIPTTNDTRLTEQEARIESLPVKFRMPDIERYSGIGCPKIHLRLYNTVMRAHGIDDAQLVALFPILCTWEDVAHEFLTQFAFGVDIDVSRRDLEATRQRPDEFIYSFVSRWRANVAGMIDRPKERIRLIWFFGTYSQGSLDAFKGNKLVGSSSRSGEVDTISIKGLHFTHLTSLLQSDFLEAQRCWFDCSFGATLLATSHSFSPHLIPPHFGSHEHCLYHHIQGHDERCSTLHHAIQDLIDSGLVNLSGPSVTTNPLLKFSIVPKYLAFLRSNSGQEKLEKESQRLL